MYCRIFHMSYRYMSIHKKLEAKSLYDSLQLTPKATQAEIKEAYYKLSMSYHPDRNPSVEASKKFRLITEAYDVLKNVHTRKLYDKGLYLNTPSHYPQEEINKFHKSRIHRSKPPPPTGKTPIYDFDEWSKSHYGATLARDLERKKRREYEKKEVSDSKEQIKKEKVFLSVLLLTLLGGYLMSYTGSYDEVPNDSFVNKKL